MEEIKKKGKRNEKGSITLFTLVAMLFFIIILILSYTSQINKISSQKKQVEKIKEEYNTDDEIEEVYNKALNGLSLSSILKVGDYVDYQPDDVTTAYDKFGENYSGYANGNIGQDDSLDWRILNINEEEGTIELISDKPTSTSVYFKGARGYNNGVALLNDYCKTMYSNESKGAIARSLNVEDIQDKMKIDETTGKKAYESYTTGTGTVYNAGTYSYASNIWYPLQWKNDKGIEGESEPKNPNGSDIIQYATEDDAKTEETTGNLVVTQTYWYLSSSTVSANFEIADTRDTTKANSMYYELLCNNGGSYYWLASRFVDARDSSYANFGLRNVSSGNVYGSYIFYSRSYETSSDGYVRPVVSIPSSAIDIGTRYDENTGWSLR